MRGVIMCVYVCVCVVYGCVGMIRLRGGVNEWANMSGSVHVCECAYVSRVCICVCVHV